MVRATIAKDFFRIILCVFISVSALAQNKTTFYNAFSSNLISVIEKEILAIEKSSSTSIGSAFKGALLVKKARFSSTPREKLELFKEGKDLLEKAIALHPQNCELRFLRYVVQSQSPDILKYKMHLTEDSEIIVSNYSELNDVVKKAIANYARKTNTLSEIISTEAK